MNRVPKTALLLALLAAVAAGATACGGGEPADPHAGHDHPPGEGHDDAKK